MTDVVATFTASIRVGLTLYVAFVLTLSAAASGPSDFSDAVRDAWQGDNDRSGEGIRYRPTDESPGSHRAMSPPPAPVGTPTPFGPTPPPAVAPGSVFGESTQPTPPEYETGRWNGRL